MFDSFCFYPLNNPPIDLSKMTNYNLFLVYPKKLSSL